MQERKVEIRYLLSEKGRKESLLAGGDGKHRQTVYTDITPDALRLARVDEEGNVLIDLTRQLAVRAEITKYGYGEPVIKEVFDFVVFDNPQTAEQLMSFERERRVRIGAEKEQLNPELATAIEEYKQEEAQRKAEKEKLLAEQEAREKASREKAERLETEKQQWISEHGSDFLKRALKLGYDCQRRYITERAAKEFPDFAVDFVDNCTWRSRSSPSDEALALVEQLIGRYNAEVVWLTFPAYELDFDEEWEACEAVVIHNYLDRYTLVHEI